MSYTATGWIGPVIRTTNTLYAASSYGGPVAKAALHVQSLIYTVSGGPVGDFVCRLPPIKTLIDSVGKDVSRFFETRSSQLLSRRFQAMTQSFEPILKAQVHIALNTALASDMAVFAGATLKQTLLKCITNWLGQWATDLINCCLETTLAKAIAGEGKNLMEEKIATEILEQVKVQLEPIVVQYSSQAVGRLTALAATNALHLYIGYQVQQLTLNAVGTQFPEVQSGIETLQGWKVTAALTAATAMAYLAPVIHRRYNQEAIKETLKLELTNYLLQRLNIENRQITPLILGQIVGTAVDELLKNSEIDVDLLQVAFHELRKNSCKQ